MMFRFPEHRLLAVHSLNNKGRVNGLYELTIETKQRDKMQLILKVTNNKWIQRKTLSEVNALAYIATHQPTVPVPKVYLFESNVSDSPLGFEYIVMEKLPVRNCQQHSHSALNQPDLGCSTGFFVAKFDQSAKGTYLNAACFLLSQVEVYPIWHYWILFQVWALPTFHASFSNVIYTGVTSKLAI